MLKRWLAFLLLTVFCLHALPVLETATDACACWAEDGSGDAGEEDGGEEPASFLKKNTAAQGCAMDETGDAARLHFDDEVATALHGAAMRIPLVVPDVVVPPPDRA